MADWFGIKWMSMSALYANTPKSQAAGKAMCFISSIVARPAVRRFMVRPSRRERSQNRSNSRCRNLTAFQCVLMGGRDKWAAAHFKNSASARQDRRQVLRFPGLADFQGLQPCHCTGPFPDRHGRRFHRPIIPEPTDADRKDPSQPTVPGPAQSRVSALWPGKAC